LILSGIPSNEKTLIEKWLQSGGFRSVEIRTDGEWVAFVAELA
jgi:ribosomal protein L11 methylase PrmA